MPIYATYEATNFWKKGHARALAASRFVTLAKDKEDKTWRKESCDAISVGSTLPAKLDSISRFHSHLLGAGAALVHAKLGARMVLNSAGGAFENGGICLDRTSGIPFIPGSAVKGCARRHAIRKLSEEEDLDAKSQLLASIALIFGFGDQEWKPGRKTESKHPHGGAVYSDFWLAMTPLFEAGPQNDFLRAERWHQVSEHAAKIIFDSLGRHPEEPQQPLATQLPNLSGNISFLPAYPDVEPRVETDVLTPHHPEYYAGDRPLATDDENPKPLFFPTVASGTTYRFPLVRLRSANERDLSQAKAWLSEGLVEHGIGAKTNAGYGWFELDTSSEKKTSKLVQDQKDAEALKALSPCPEIEGLLQEYLVKQQLAGELNRYSFDPQFWPKDSTLIYQLTLFHFVRNKAPELGASKKGDKAMQNLAKKLNLPYP